MGRSAQNLDHDGLLGSAEDLHRLVMGGFGEVFAIDLEEEAGRNKSSASTFPAPWSVPTRTGDPERRLRHSEIVKKAELIIHSPKQV